MLDSAWRRAIVPLSLALVLTGPFAAAQQERPAALHVRSTDRQILDVLQEGSDRSPTFKALLDELEASDVIVYVQPAAELPPEVEGHLRFAGTTAAARYLRIVVNPKMRGDRLIALVGHELQHAREVAEATQVRDTATFAAMYRAIGDRNAQGWDTEAACVMAGRVRDELQRNGQRVVALRPNGQ